MRILLGLIIGAMSIDLFLTGRGIRPPIPLDTLITLVGIIGVVLAYHLLFHKETT